MNETSSLRQGVVVVGLLVLLGCSGLSGPGVSDATRGAPGHGPAAEEACVPGSGPVQGVTACPKAGTPADSSVNSSSVIAWSSLPGEGSGNVSGAGLAEDSPNAEAVQFGGITPSGLSSVTQVYHEATNGWTTVAVGEPAPSPRSGSGFAADPGLGDAVLFGGAINLTSGAAGNDTWLFNFSRDAWTNITAPVAPQPREDAAFAVDPRAHIALLFGGWDPDFENSGQVTYSDTWEFNFSTEAWTHLSVGGDRLPALYGAAMVWDPLEQEFDIFGGCYPCTANLWTFDPATDTWTAVQTGGTLPTARMQSVWAFDPALSADVLFGGTDGTTVAGDTYLYFPTSDLWVGEPLAPAPLPRFAAAAVWLNVTGNETLLMTGGADGTTFFNETWRLASTSTIDVTVENASSLAPIPGASVRLNGGSPATTGAGGFTSFEDVASEEVTVAVTALGYAPNSTSFWVAPGSVTPLVILLQGVATETVDVAVNDTTGAVLAGALVNLSSGGHAVVSTGTTDAEGWANFTSVPAFQGTVSGWAVGYHTTTVLAPFAPGTTLRVNLTLIGLAEVQVTVTGLLPNGTVVPLNGATVHLGSIYLGLTAADGVLTSPTTVFGATVVNATAPYFASNQTLVSVPATGTLDVHLELASAPAGSIALSVLDEVSLTPVGPAQVNFTRLAPTTVAPISFSSIALRGLLFEPLLAGNYSLTVVAPGFEQNSSVPPQWIRPGVLDPLTVLLTPIPRGALDTIVLDRNDQDPIAGATVVLETVGSEVSNGQGWANFTGLTAGTYALVASAPGYEINTTAATLTPGEVIDRFPVNLTPAPPASGPGGQDDVALLPPNSVSILPLLLLPALAVALAIVYLTVLRVPEAAVPPPAPTEVPGPTEPTRPRRRFVRRGRSGGPT